MDLTILKRNIPSEIYIFIKNILHNKIKQFYFDIFIILNAYKQKLKSKIISTLITQLKDDVFTTKNHILNIDILVKDLGLDIGDEYIIQQFKKSLNDIYTGFLLASEQGIGKTRQSCILLQLHNKFIAHNKNTTVLYIAPLSIIEQNKVQLENYLDSNQYDITTSHFEGLEKLQSKNFDYIIIDECHLANNVDTKRFQEIVQFVKNCKFVFLLSASPIRSNIEEIQSYLYLMLISNSSNKQVYTKTFDDFLKIYDRQLPSYKNLLAIRKLQLLSGRLTQKDVYEITNIGLLNIKKIHLQAKDVIREHNLLLTALKNEYVRKYTQYKKLNQKLVEYIQKHPYFRDIVYQYLNDLIEFDIIEKNINNQEILNILKIIKKYLDKSVQQAIYSKVFSELLVKTIEKIFSSKQVILPLLKLIIQQQKCILFTKSREAIDKIKLNLMKHGIDNIYIIEPEHDSKTRFEIIQKFQQSKNVSVLISTYKSLAHGFNIPDCNCIILIDVPYRPYEFEQSINRINRASNSNNFEKEIFILSIQDEDRDILSHDEQILKEYYQKIKYILDKLNYS